MSVSDERGAERPVRAVPVGTNRGAGANHTAEPAANVDTKPARELAQQAKLLNQKVQAEVARVVVGVEEVT